MQDDTPSSASISPTPPPLPQHPHNNKISRLLIIGVAFGFIVLLTTITVLAVAVIQKGSFNTTAKTANADESVVTTKQVIATATTKNENINFLLYKPRQTANNTTIDFALKNTCETNCPVKSYAAELYSPTHTGTTMNNMYLIDEAAAEKYTVIIDTRDIGLVSPQCYGSLKPGQRIDCFMSFAKVPSGSTVSLVMRDFRIDGILVP